MLPHRDTSDLPRVPYKPAPRMRGKERRKRRAVIPPLYTSEPDSSPIPDQVPKNVSPPPDTPHESGTSHEPQQLPNENRPLQPPHSPPNIPRQPSRSLSNSPVPQSEMDRQNLSRSPSSRPNSGSESVIMQDKGNLSVFHDEYDFGLDQQSQEQGPNAPELEPPDVYDEHDGDTEELEAGEPALLQRPIVQSLALDEEIDGLLVISDDSDEETGETFNEVHELSPTFTRQDSGTMRTMRRRLHKVLRWEQILSLLCLDGRSAFTEKQYKILAASIHTCRDDVFLSDPRTIRNTVRPSMLRYNYASSNIYFVGGSNDVSNEATINDSASVPTMNNGQADPSDCVRLVLPTDWAKLDVSTWTFYRDVFLDDVHNSMSERTSGVDIELTRIVTDRKKALLQEVSLQARLHGSRAMLPVEPDDIIYFRSAQDPDLPSKDIKGWKTRQITRAANKDPYYSVEGSVAQTIVVGSNTPNAQNLPNSDMPDSYLLSETELLNNCQEPTHKLNKSFSRRFPTMTLSKVRQRVNSTVVSNSDLELYAGDTVTVLRPTDEEITEGIVCILHTSPIAVFRRRAPERVMWLSIDLLDSRQTCIRILQSVNIIGVATFTQSTRKLQSVSTKKLTRSNMGTINNEHYVIYRVSLYADGFQENKSTRQSKSVGGVYLLPLGIPCMERRSAKSVRPLCLTPSGCSINKVIKIIMEDLHKGATEGVRGVDANGKPVRIFIDTVSLLGDFPQATAFTDVLGHTANSLCTMCTMRRRKGRNFPETNYSMDIHSSRLGFARFNMRRQAIRSSKPDREILRFLGMEYLDNVQPDKLPAVYFSRLLEDSLEHQQQQNAEDIQLISTPIHLMFDHARSVPILPDHMLSTIVSNVMAACFYKLEDNQLRAKVERHIVQAATRNGLGVKTHILSWKKNKTGTSYNGIASNAMSAWFCILCVASPIFKDIHSEKGDSVYLLPEKLQELLSLVYRWPDPVCEGKRCAHWDFSSMHDQLLYQNQVMEAGIVFLMAARHEYTVEKQCGAFIDKPNIHRLLEFVTVTIPMFGHPRLCSEMILEHTHQLFKKWLQQNTHRDSHLTAMEKVLGRDWMWRLSTLFSCWSRGGEEDRRRAEVGLRRILVGEIGCRMDHSSKAGVRFSKELSDRLEDTMQEPVLNLLQDCDEMNSDWTGNSEYIWSAVYMDKTQRFHPDCHEAIEHIVSQAKDDNLAVTDFEFYQRARYMAKVEGGAQRSYRHNCVEVGESISAVIDEVHDGQIGSRVLRTAENGDGECKFFLVRGIIGNVRTEEVWIVCSQWEQKGGYYDSEGMPVRLLQLSKACRRVAMVPRYISSQIIHTNSEDSSDKAAPRGLYHLISRSNGFPPFLG